MSSFLLGLFSNSLLFNSFIVVNNSCFSWLHDSLSRKFRIKTFLLVVILHNSPLIFIRSRGFGAASLASLVIILTQDWDLNNISSVHLLNITIVSCHYLLLIITSVSCLCLLLIITSVSCHCLLLIITNVSCHYLLLISSSFHLITVSSCISCLLLRSGFFSSCCCLGRCCSRCS